MADDTIKIKQFLDNDVYRDSNGEIWVKLSDSVEMIKLAIEITEKRLTNGTV